MLHLLDLSGILLTWRQFFLDFSDNLLNFGKFVLLIVSFLIVDYFPNLIKFVEIKVAALI